MPESSTDWVDVGAAAELAREPLREVAAGTARIALSCVDGEFGALSGICNHVGGPLGQGQLDGEYVVCPWHQYKFHRKSGAGEPGYEADRVPSYAVRVVDGRVLVSARPVTKRGHLPHAPHPLAREPVRTPGPIRVAGISTTMMQAGFPRYSTSEALLDVALGQILAQSAGAVALLWYLRSGAGRLRLVLRGTPIRRELFGDILRVGAVACLSPLQSVTTMVLMAGFVAQLGVLPLAGFAIGQRLEFLMTTVAFGFGLASVPMVGMAIGAGRVARARRVAWTAGAVTASLVSVVGVVVALVPDLWVAIFTRDDAVLGYGRQYLRWAGPGFGFFGLGLTLYFASQGAGRMAGPVLAATMRLLVVAAGGSLLLAHGAEPWQLFALAAAAMLMYGGTCALAMKVDRWGAAR